MEPSPKWNWWCATVLKMCLVFSLPNWNLKVFFRSCSHEQWDPHTLIPWFGHTLHSVCQMTAGGPDLWTGRERTCIIAQAISCSIGRNWLIFFSSELTYYCVTRLQPHVKSRSNQKRSLIILVNLLLSLIFTQPYSFAHRRDFSVVSS